MAGVLRVNAADLRASANFLDTHHGDLQGAHSEAVGQMESELGGLPGAAARALQAKIEQWVDVHAHQCGELGHHHSALQAVATAFETLDEDKATDILRTRAAGS